MKTLIPPSAGYVFNSAQHGAFDPDGRVAAPVAQAEVDAHNAEVSRRVLADMQATGRALLYLSNGFVATWDGSKKWAVQETRTSWHNMAGRDGRTDVWFSAFGTRWQGVNIGDNQIVRCARIKS